jgi:hypothetical protein
MERINSFFKVKKFSGYFMNIVQIESTNLNEGLFNNSLVVRFQKTNGQTGCLSTNRCTTR